MCDFESMYNSTRLPDILFSLTWPCCWLLFSDHGVFMKTVKCFISIDISTC